jgi:HTH-type transcriptional regulator / antitoxin HigA
VTTMLDQETKAAYLELVGAFPLVSIRDDAQLHEALEIVRQLVRKDTLSAAEEAYLGALADLVETYENAHVHIPPTSGVEALRYLMEENDLSQADLVPEFGTASIVSEVLAGKRRLSLTHIQRLATRFGLSADVFIDAPAKPTTRRR